MGRRGPPPKPTQLRLIEGNPGHRPINHDEPKPKTGPPRRPAWMTTEERKVWRRMLPILAGMRVLTVADGDALAAYCATYVRWRKAEEFIREHGMTYPLRDLTGRVSSIVPFPEVAIARNLLALLRAYQQEFGLTPSSRSRIALGRPGGSGVASDFPEELGDAEVG